MPEGTTVGLVGESGSGKSTLARALVGLVAARRRARSSSTTSRVRIARSGRAADRRRRVQMIFQDPFSSLNPRMTRRRAIAEALAVRGGRGAAARGDEAVRDYLDLVHLDADLAGRFPSRLSGGQRQRVAIARALAARPEVLIADEITSSLDVSVQSAVLNLMRELQRRARALDDVRLAQPRDRPLRERRARGHVPRAHRRGRADRRGRRGPAAPVHARRCSPPCPRLVRTSARRADLELGDPPDPHHPPSGCHFHPALPGRPAWSLPTRQVCVERDPREGADARPHRAVCHFARRPDGAAPSARHPERSSPMSLAIDSPSLQRTARRPARPSTASRARRSPSSATARSTPPRPGLLNLDTGVEATTDSLFQIGSITKVWTATVVMQLVDEGLVELDAPLRRYLPDFRVADERRRRRR